MDQYDQMVQFEKTALAIFHQIKTYIPSDVLWDYLERSNPSFLRKKENGKPVAMPQPTPEEQIERMGGKIYKGVYSEFPPR